MDVRLAILLEFRILIKTAMDRFMSSRFETRDNKNIDLVLRIALRCVAGLLAIFIVERIDFSYSMVKVIMGLLVVYAIVAAIGRDRA